MKKTAGDCLLPRSPEEEIKRRKEKGRGVRDCLTLGLAAR
jgi:hypothetical protein